MKPISCRRWLSRAALAGAALVLAEASPAHAVIVEGRVNLSLADWTGSYPAPLQLPPLGTAPPVLGFTYDTDRVAAISGNPRDDGTAYTFRDDGAASVFITLNGYTYSTTSFPGNDLTFGIGAISGDNSFSIDLEPRFADPSNPLPWLPKVSFTYGHRPDAFANGMLPTSGSFSASTWDDPDVYLVLEPPGHQQIRFIAVGDMTFTTVPEPRASWLLFLVPIAAVAMGARRLRAGGARTPAPCPSP
jgi:hypothetical protein